MKRVSLLILAILSGVLYVILGTGGLLLFHRQALKKTATNVPGTVLVLIAIICFILCLRFIARYYKSHHQQTNKKNKDK
jgi:hypothetical protein